MERRKEKNSSNRKSAFIRREEEKKYNGGVTGRTINGFNGALCIQRPLWRGRRWSNCFSTVHPITSSLAKKRRELVAETAQDPCYSYSKLVIFLLFPLTIVYSFVLFHFLSLLFSKFEFRIRVSILLIDSIDIYWLWVNCNE